MPHPLGTCVGNLTGRMTLGFRNRGHISPSQVSPIGCFVYRRLHELPLTEQNSMQRGSVGPICGIRGVRAG